MTKTPEEILYEQYKDIFDYVTELIKISQNNLNESKLDTLSKAITSFHYTRSIKLLDAIFILCLRGYASEANVLLRSLLNLCINLKWLTKQDTEARMMRYADFEVIYKKRRLDISRDYSSLSRQFPKKDFAIYDKEFNRIKNKYGLNPKNYKDLNNWSGKSIWGMAKDVGFIEHYETVYSSLSEMEHTSPSSVRQYMDDSEPGVIGAKVGPQDDNVYICLLTSLGYFLSIKRIVLEMFQLKLSTLEIEDQQFMTLYKKYENLQNKK